MSPMYAVEKFLARLPERAIFTAAEIRHLGRANAVYQVLSRLSKRGRIFRLARGVYWNYSLKPTRRLLPAPHEVAQAKLKGRAKRAAYLARVAKRAAFKMNFSPPEVIPEIGSNDLPTPVLDENQTFEGGKSDFRSTKGVLKGFRDLLAKARLKEHQRPVPGAPRWWSKLIGKNFCSHKIDQSIQEVELEQFLHSNR